MLNVRGKLHAARKHFTTNLSYLLLRADGVLVGEGVKFDGIPIVTGARLGRISIGDRCVLVSRSVGTALGVRSAVIIRLLHSGAQIQIGSDTGLSGTVICSASAVTIGERCLIGADVVIFDTEFHNLDPRGRRYGEPKWDKISAPVVIGDDVFIGTRSMIMKGVTIGSGSIIGAGSIVSSDVPSNTIAAGVPAHMIRRLSGP